ncbi:ATP-binding protein [Capnocytophaga sp.]|uniref:ATP-binding protein n=1 Tax=Capnocytophaga sp. TaxID=44737 RepID=UPI0026DA79AE|nr:AAA family ATPase [Capnocytophaga sp.]MDO5106602.1 AAA family ATPase [Capnocytophaga sp.]
MADNNNIPRAYTYEDLKRKKYNTLPLSASWADHLGKVERAGSILIYGKSGHGKTTYALQLMKELCKHEKVLYNSLEECGSLSMVENLDMNGLQPYKNKYTVQKEKVDKLIRRLSRPQQPKIVFIDSIQECFDGKPANMYNKLIEMFPTTLFIGISQVDGKGNPKGAVANKFYWLCQNRIVVQDFVASIEKTRTGANEIEPYIISEKKAAEREFKLNK